MEITFTSGGTEADNLAIFGIVPFDGHIVASSIEHHAVLHAVKRACHVGAKLSLLPVDRCGRVDPDDVMGALTKDTSLISVMMANNETGVIQPVNEIGEIARKHGILFHVDAVQAAGKLSIDVEKIGCDLLSISGHKMHGPQGSGALFIRRGVELQPMLYGGSHEMGRRAGTENVAGIVGLGLAAQLGTAGLADGTQGGIGRLRDDLEEALLRKHDYAAVNGFSRDRISNTSNIRFEGIDGAMLLMILDELGVSVSGGSACAADSQDGSHVLRAMGLSIAQSQSSIRFSLSKMSTSLEVEMVVEKTSQALSRLHSMRREKTIS